MKIIGFTIFKRDKNSKARLGILRTRHGIIKTPSYVMVATQGYIKCLKPPDIKKTKTQIVIANTYHLWEKALKESKNSNFKSQKYSNQEIKTFLIQKLGINMPTMTDSGGFQVFSLGFGIDNKVGKILDKPFKKSQIKKIKRQNIKITDKGVYFKIDGPPSQGFGPLRRSLSEASEASKKRFLGPELSMKIQSIIGADIVFAFDECTSPLDDYKYNEKALKRTSQWAKISLRKRDPRQLVFGIVQGGKYRILREKSARQIGAMEFDGFGIGGSFGKDEMVKTLRWVIPYLPEEKPRHLLGIGRIEDVFSAIENGVDLFDCVIPTREARHARLWTDDGPIDIRKSRFINDKKIIDKKCKCPTCKKINRAQLYKLFKDPKLIEKAKTFATIHNVYFFNNLVERIRDSISKNKFSQFKKSYLKHLKSPVRGRERIKLSNASDFHAKP